MSSKTTVFIIYYIHLVLINKSLSLELQRVQPQSRIINGYLAKLGQFPYVCFIENWAKPVEIEYGWICTGSILSKIWVITARHCYTGYKDGDIPMSDIATMIRAGTIDRSVPSAPYQERYAISYGILDRRPNLKLPLLYNNDIILVKVDKPFEFNEFVGRVIGLKAPFPDPGNKTHCIVIGFGRDTFSTNIQEPVYNTKLRFAHMTIDGDPATCMKRANQNDLGRLEDWNESHLCADPVEFKKAPCSGDSGGPLVCNGLLAGVSTGRLSLNDVKEYPLCGTQWNYHVYMFVGMFERWIRRNVRDLPPFRQLAVGGGESPKRGMTVKNPTPTFRSGTSSGRSHGVVTICVLLAVLNYNAFT